MPLPQYQVIASTCDGDVHDLEFPAPDAPSAVVKAAMQIRHARTDTTITHVHARPADGRTE